MKKFIGLSVEQTDSFLAKHVAPIVRKHKKLLGRRVDLKV